MAYDLIKISALPAATPDESQEIVVGVGDLAKRINYGDVKADMVGTSPTYTTDTEPYLMRQTANIGVVGKCALNKLVGGSLGWNQLAKELNSTNWTNEDGTTASFTEGVATFTSTINNNGIVIQYSLSTFANHKYFLCMDVKSSTAYTGLSLGIPGSGQPMIRFTDSIGGDTAWHTIEGIRECTSSDNLKRIYIFRTNGTVEDLRVKKVIFHDLTLDFGSTIADYVYGLEQATAGAGIAKLKSWGIDLDTYHAYDAGSIQSVQATAHVTTGKNLIDQTQFVQGSITGSGADSAVTIRLRSPFVKVSPNTQYSLSVNSEVLLFEVHQYDANKNWLGYLAINATSYTFTTRSDAEYIKLLIRYSNNATIVVSALTALQMQFGSIATAYEPYVEHTYPLGSDTLRGIPQLVSNKLAYDGDEKYPDGTIKRKYGIVDMGSLNWSYSSSDLRFVTTGLSLAKAISSVDEVAKMICPRYPTSAYRYVDGRYQTDKIIGLYGTGSTNYLAIKDTVYTDATTLKNSLSGVYLVYPLETETTESSTAYQKIQTIDADGTESFATSSPVPVGHETQTPDNILAALGWLGE